MSHPYVVKAQEGFDIYSAGTLANNYPWQIITPAETPNIVSGAGVFGGNALAFNTGTTNAQSVSYDFPSNGQFMRNSTANTGVYLYAMNFWFQCSVAPTSTTPLPIVQWSTQASLTSVIPVMGIVLSGAQTNICFPSTVASIATSPYTAPVTVGTWYWINIMMVGYPNGQLFATYELSTVPIQTGVALTYGSDPISTNTCNAAVFYGGGTTLGQYLIDDMMIQASCGADTDWPFGGGGTSTPTNPSIGSAPIIPPQRIYALPASGNGSTTQWTTMDNGVTPNWQAASEGGSGYVQATASGQTDLYTVSTASATISNPIAVSFRAASNKYLAIEPTSQDSGGAITQNPGVVSTGPSEYVAVMESTNAGNPWTSANIGTTGFGQTSL